MKILAMCLAFYLDPLLIATLAFPAFIIACVLAALFIKDRNKRL